MSEREVRVCGIAELDPESHMQVMVPGVGALAVFHVDGRFYVTDDSCTHMQASLGEEGRSRGTSSSAPGTTANSTYAPVRCSVRRVRRPSGRTPSAVREQTVYIRVAL